MKHTNIHVLRGGSWSHYDSYFVRVAYRNDLDPDYRYYGYGFRLTLKL